MDQYTGLNGSYMDESTVLDRLASRCYRQFIYEKLTRESVLLGFKKYKIRVLDIRKNPAWLTRCHRRYEPGYGKDSPFYVMIDPLSDPVDEQRLRRIRYNCRRHTKVKKLFHIRFKYGPKCKTKHVIRCILQMIDDSRERMKSKTYIVK